MFFDLGVREYFCTGVMNGKGRCRIEKGMNEREERSKE